jgi:threonyl-tRNA synthetase
MKILTIHADFIEFEPKKKAFKGAEEGIDKERTRVEECLVVFTAFEKTDEENTQGVKHRYLQEIKNIAQQVNAQSIVLYPYAHLSSNLGNPKLAEQFMKDAEKTLAEKYKVTRSPFGWYKSFNISCKGHPLSELSREFGSDRTAGKSDSSSLKRESRDELFVFEDKEITKEERLNLSTAFILAKAIKDLNPNTEIADVGLHHNQSYVDFSKLKVKNEDWKKIEGQMTKVVNADIPIGPATRDDIQGGLQIEILKDIGQDKAIYKLEDVTLVPLQKNSFVDSTKEISAFKIVNTGSVYWKANDNNEQLTRIYCVGFVSKERLDGFLKAQEKAENRSHLKIGKDQGLFVHSELVGSGLPLLAPKGMIIRNEIVKFLWDLHKDEGYQQVWTPHIAKDLLYKTSGHWDKFGDELFKVKGKTEDFILKPMSCPHHMQIFDHFSYSYRDLPIRFFEPATVYRDEKSGQLLGLVRVRSITQDDGHLFCRLSQITQEAQKIVEIVHKFYKVMGMDSDYWVSLSVRGDDKSKYLGSDEGWEIAEKALEEAAENLKLPYKKITGEAAFYGPKLDFMFKDSMEREWQLATIQCDFNLPERFDLNYMNEESKKERPVVIHRAITGALERFMAVCIEHFAGKFPLWLSPVQVKVVTVTDRNLEFAKAVYAKMRAHDIRVELDDRSETMGKKVRDAQVEHVNYIVTIGDKEVEKKNIAVRDRSGDNTFDVDVDHFVKRVVEEIRERKL